jgi:hypothetical protein
MTRHCKDLSEDYLQVYLFSTPNMVHDVIVHWDGDARDPMEIDISDPGYPTNYSVAKILWLANNYTRLTERLIAIEKLVLESAIRDKLASATFPSLII